MLWKNWKTISMCFLMLSGMSSDAFAQYFARNSVQLPCVGWLGLDSSFSGANDPTWGADDQIQVGTGYARDLSALKLWWITETAFGISYVNYPGAPSSRMAISIQGGTGIKYNFLVQYWRPFIGLMAEVFQIFNFQDSRFISEVAAPTWGALRPMLGLEWMFANDMSLEVESGYIMLINFEDPVRHSALVRLAYRLYF